MSTPVGNPIPNVEAIFVFRFIVSLRHIEPTNSKYRAGLSVVSPVDTVSVVTRALLFVLYFTRMNLWEVGGRGYRGTVDAEIKFTSTENPELLKIKKIKKA